jgi:hypothetical protein
MRLAYLPKWRTKYSMITLISSGFALAPRATMLSTMAVHAARSRLTPITSFIP